MAGCCAITELDQTVEPIWLKKLDGKGRARFARAYARMRQHVGQAERDGAGQLVPVILFEERPVATLRAALGKATWRKIHHASLRTNLLRALVYQRFSQSVTWDEIVSIPEYHLRSCRNALDWETAQFASSHAPAGQFHKFAMLYRDIVKLGITPNPEWSIARLRRERDRLFTAAKIDEADAHPWANAFEFVKDEYVFSRLVSDQDVVREGINMRHCVASYLAEARKGQAYILRCEGNERATYLFRADGTEELRGFANAEVSDACRLAVEAARAALIADTGPPTG